MRRFFVAAITLLLAVYACGEPIDTVGARSVPNDGGNDPTGPDGAPLGDGGQPPVVGPDARTPGTCAEKIIETIDEGWQAAANGWENLGSVGTKVVGATTFLSFAADGTAPVGLVRTTIPSCKAVRVNMEFRVGSSAVNVLRLEYQATRWREVRYTGTSLVVESDKGNATLGAPTVGTVYPLVLWFANDGEVRGGFAEDAQNDPLDALLPSAGTTMALEKIAVGPMDGPLNRTVDVKKLELHFE